MSPLTDRQNKRPVLAKLVHFVRVALVIALLAAIPATSRPMSEGSVAPLLSQIPRGTMMPGIRIDLDQNVNGMWPLLDEHDNLNGFLARTLPAAKGLVGYRGPSEACIVLDTDLTLAAVSLLGSSDTEAHVEAVIADAKFFDQFKGWPWGGPPADTHIDGVSGATLTSLAIAEGVLKRIGGARPSLVFAASISIDEIQDWYPNAASIDEASGRVRDADDETLGRVLRTGPKSDDVVGYQGPTEMLIKVNSSGTIDAIRIRRSFDNEPYVDYVRTERGFWKTFTNQSITELSDFDPEAEGVEGVSGATMTSLAVADTLVAAAKEFAAQAKRAEEPIPKWYETIRWTRSDIATIGMLLLAGLLSLLGLFRNRIARRLWLVLVITVIGLWAGNLVSMALISGWAAEGIGWRLAPGLCAIALVSLLVPAMTKGNPYCNHLCPHGSIQQLIKPGQQSRRRWKPKPSTMKWITKVPGITLVLAYLILIVVPTIDLSSWEPFHAYLFQIASWSSLLLAIATLALSATIPMGYCRLGCPTGRLIDYLRRTSISHRITSADFVAAGLLIFALVYRGL